MADKNATLKLPDGKSLDFPVLSGTTGPDVVDIRTLYGKSGMFTYDPGYLSTASCSSSITYIDGDAGVLLYRGFTYALEIPVGGVWLGGWWLASRLGTRAGTPAPTVGTVR